MNDAIFKDISWSQTVESVNKLLFLEVEMGLNVYDI